MIVASIVTYKTDKEELEVILSCCDKSCIDKIFIVDNSPTDELQKNTYFSSKIEYIWGHGNVGYGSAHNMAITKSIEYNAKYHVIINPDIYFDPRIINELKDYMEMSFEIGQIMPKIIYPNGELQYLCKLLPTPLDLIGRRFIPFKQYIEKRNYKYEMKAFGYDKIIEVPFLSGCFMFLRVEALDKTKGFDDNYFMYCEDIDLCRRIGMAGYKTVYYPNVTVVHAHKKESFKNKMMLKSHIQSALRYFNKWGWFFDNYRKEINKRIESQYCHKDQ